MKTKFTNVYTILCCLAILLASVSCETEQLNLNDDLLLDSDSSLLKKGKAKTSPAFEYCDFEYDADPETGGVKLIAGQFTEVGKVTVEKVGDNYKITYTITEDGYCISETHLSVVTNTGDFPLSGGGNPKNGNFEYSGSHDCESSVEYLVPIVDGPYIAAHAVVNCIPTVSIEDLDALLPESVDFCITSGRDIADAKSYIYLQIADGSLAGDYWTWCADEIKGFDGGETNGDALCYYDNAFKFYTLIDDLSGIISQPENTDNALWLINNSEEILNSGNYLYGHIQWALWKLLNNQECNSCAENLKLIGEGDYVTDAMALYNRARDEGEGYSPECGENTMVFLDDGVNQPILIPFPIECDEVECEETAWGAANGEGCEFPGNNWATYFNVSEGSSEGSSH